MDFQQTETKKTVYSLVMKTLKPHLTASGWQKNKYFLMTRMQGGMSALQALSHNTISPEAGRETQKISLFHRET